MDKHEHGHEHGHHYKKFKQMMLLKIARDLVMRCYPANEVLSYDQVKEAAERIHEIKKILKDGKD